MPKKILDLGKLLVLSDRAFLLFALVSVSAVPLSFGISNTHNGSIQSFALGIASTALTYLAFKILLLILRKSDQVAALISFLVLVIVGAVRGFAISSLAGLVHLTDPSPVVSRITNSIVTTVIWLGLACILIESNRRYHRRYRAILSQLMIANVQKSETLDPTFSSAAKDLAQLQINLKATHFRASRTAVNSSDVVQAANEIRSQIDNAIRPLSRRLWVSSIYEFPRIRLIPLFLEAMRTLKFPLAPVIVIFAITTTFNYSVTFGPRIGFARALGGTAVLLACEILRRRLHLTLPTLNVLYLFSIGFIVNLVSTLTTSAIEFKKYLGFYLALSPEVGSLILIISVISLAAADRTEILNNLRSQVINEQVQQLKGQSEIQGAQLASYLHNSLQSELSAIALQLEFASQNPRSGDIEEILERLNAIVQRSLSEDFLSYLETPRERFDRIISSWDGIVLIRHQIEPAIFMDPIRATLFIQLIQEGIANAVRRGNASLVEIESQYDSEVLKVGIWNDGDFDITSKAGLGHEWIERLAVSEWSIQPSGQGTKLEVEF